jgi:hypothetical protein|eukprot:2847678-Prymnesium_polylepis.1
MTQIENQRGDTAQIGDQIGTIEPVVKEDLDAVDAEKMHLLSKLHQCPQDESVVARPVPLVAKDWELGDDEEGEEGHAAQLVRPVAEARGIS